jgi:hypothetical protein
VAFVIILGGMIGFTVMRGEYQGSANEEAYGVTHAKQRPPIILVQKSLPEGTP